MIAIDYNLLDLEMKFVALLSGGKDSVFTIMKLLNSGEHDLVCLANLYPP
jgi:diphthamide synthase (EF-2-diphthine--ammonia ligase)